MLVNQFSVSVCLYVFINVFLYYLLSVFFRKMCGMVLYLESTVNRHAINYNNNIIN